MKPIREVGAAATVVAAAPSAQALPHTPIRATKKKRNNWIPWVLIFSNFLGFITPPTFPQFSGLNSRGLPLKPFEARLPQRSVPSFFYPAFYFLRTGYGFPARTRIRVT